MLGFATTNPLLFMAAKFCVLGVIFFMIEKIRPAEPKTPFLSKNFATETYYYFFNNLLFGPILNAVLGVLLYMILIPFFPYQFFSAAIQEWPLLVQILVGCLLIDFGTYWRHRLSHTAKSLWQFHAVHHSAESLTWLTKNRLHFMDLTLALVFNILVLHIFGFSGVGIIIAFMVVDTVDYFCHANLNFGFKGRMRYLICSPNYHRWHHATNKEAFNKNYVAMFPFYDYIFGTYYYPTDKMPDGYGLSPEMQKKYPHDFFNQLYYPFVRLIKMMRKN